MWYRCSMTRTEAIVIETRRYLSNVRWAGAARRDFNDTGNEQAAADAALHTRRAHIHRLAVDRLRFPYVTR